ncbi:ABC transporter ATP-binding protein [Bartonella sp. LJL80]
MQNNTPLLKAENIVLRYPDNEAAILENFDLSIGKQEIVGLLGPSGVGKSSLLRILAGLQKPDQGRITVHGQELRHVHPRLAVAFQNPGLLPWLNLEHNVGFGLNFKHQPRLTKQQRQQRVDKAIQQVGLEDARKRRPNELSGGMAQRAGLARCLAREPEILFLDEPFGALDELTRAQMQQLLVQLVDQSGASALLVTHDIDEALLTCDRIILLGGSPASAIGTWQIELAKPRNHFVEELGTIRIEILSALRDATAKKENEND